jgi:hypothetical protein
VSTSGSSKPAASSRPGRRSGSTTTIVVVGDQDRLGPLHGHVLGPGHQPRPALADEQIGEHLGRRAALVVAVGRALHDGRIGPEGGVVDERAAGDEAQVDPELDPVGERLQAPGRVLPVQPEVEGEVVAGAGRDDQQRDVVLGGDPGHQRLGPISAGHPQQVGPVGHRRAGQLVHVHGPRPLEQGDLGPEGLGLVLETEPGHLPPARARVHDQIGPLGRRGVVLAHPLGYDLAAQRRPAGGDGQSQQPQRHQHDPHQPPARVQHQHHQRRQDGQGDNQPADKALVGQGPPHPGRGQGQADHADQHQGHARPEPDRRQGHEHGRRGGHQGQASQPALGDTRPPRRLLLSGHHPLITAHSAARHHCPQVSRAPGRPGITRNG